MPSNGDVNVNTEDNNSPSSVVENGTIIDGDTPLLPADTPSYMYVSTDIPSNPNAQPITENTINETPITPDPMSDIGNFRTTGGLFTLSKYGPNGRRTHRI